MINADRHLEIEVKFHLRDPEDLRRRLFDAGALCSHPRVFELNRRYEDRNHNLIHEGKLLRLRKDNACRLTFKSPPEQDDGNFKVHREFEVGVTDFDAMDALLTALGYHAVQTYEKWRETFVLDDAEICIDELPFGCFAEIEGTRPGIRAAAEKLAMTWENRILHNYLAMFQLLRREAGLHFEDITFENFQNRSLDIESYLHFFRATRPA